MNKVVITGWNSRDKDKAVVISGGIEEDEIGWDTIYLKELDFMCYVSDLEQAIKALKEFS